MVDIAWSGEPTGPRGPAGPAGPPGPPGDGADVTAAQIEAAKVAAEQAADEAATKAAEAEDAKVAAEAVGALADAQIAGQLGTEGSASNAVLKDQMGQEVDAKAAPGGPIVPQAKAILGGVVPKPLRAPSLIVERSFPDAASRMTHRIVWADGADMYAIGRDRAIRKSADYGRTWSVGVAPTPNISLGSAGAFLKLPSGTLLSPSLSSPEAIYRSTDDGANWTAVHTLRAGKKFLGVQSWDFDPTTGHIYYIEYDPITAPADTRIVRSTDDGATWSTFYTFPGSAALDPWSIRHGHGVQWDTVSARLYFLTGDNDSTAGIFRLNASGDGIERVVTSGQIAYLGGAGDNARTISLMFFPDYIAWAADSPSHGAIYRMHRSQIGAATPEVEKVYRINSSGFFSIKAADDGTRWLVTATAEGGARIDNSSHVYAVEDNGATVYEVATIAHRGTALGCLAPIGGARWGGADQLWLAAHEISREDDTRIRAYFKCRLAYGGPSVAAPEAPDVLAYQSATLTHTTMGVSESKTFGCTAVPATQRRLRIYDAGIGRTSGTIVARVTVYNRSTDTVLWQSPLFAADGYSMRARSRIESAADIATIDIPGVAIEAILFRVDTYSSGTGWEGTASITYGWSPTAT